MIPKGYTLNEDGSYTIPPALAEAMDGLINQRNVAEDMIGLIMGRLAEIEKRMLAYKERVCSDLSRPGEGWEAIYTYGGTVRFDNKEDA